MARKDGQADRRRVVARLRELVHEHEVAQGLRHFHPVEGDHAGVDIVARHAVDLQRRLGVRRGEFVVRKRQVGSAALDGEVPAQAVGRNGGALHVPARPARPERRIPGGLALAVAAPYQRVQRVALAFAVGVAATFSEVLLHSRAVQVGLVAELLGGLDGGVDVAVVELVGRAGVEKLLHHRDHLVYRLHRTDVVARRDHGQDLHVAAEQVDLAGAEFAPVHAVAFSALEQRIVHVGDVLHVVDLVAVGHELALRQVEGEVGCGVAEVGGVVRRDAADVHPHLPVRVRGGVYFLDALIGGVVELQRHRGAGDCGYGRVGPSMHAHNPTTTRPSRQCRAAP